MTPIYQLSIYVLTLYATIRIDTFKIVNNPPFSHPPLTPLPSPRSSPPPFLYLTTAVLSHQSEFVDVSVDQQYCKNIEFFMKGWTFDDLMKLRCVKDRQTCSNYCQDYKHFNYRDCEEGEDEINCHVSSRTHSLTHSLTHLLPCPPTQPLTHSLTHPLTRSLTYPPTHSLTHSLSHTHALTHA